MVQTFIARLSLHHLALLYQQARHRKRSVTSMTLALTIALWADQLRDMSANEFLKRCDLR